jgi:hypothetical protein
LPTRLIWTDAQDNQIRRLCVEGASWDKIAAILGFSRWTVIERGHRIGVSRPAPEFVLPPPDDPARDPLPAGHPRSWGAITAGTLLENAPYDLPNIPR